MTIRILVIDDKIGRLASHQRQLRRIVSAAVSERGAKESQPTIELSFCTAQRFQGGEYRNDIPEAISAAGLSVQSGAPQRIDWALVLVDMQFDYGPVTEAVDEPRLVAPLFGLEVEAALLALDPSLPIVRFTSTHERDLGQVGARPFLSKLELFSDGDRGAEAMRMVLVRYGRLPITYKRELLQIPVATPVASPKMLDAYIEARMAAKSDQYVLIRGEAGTGKEVVARYMHSVSSRSDGPFVGRNLASIPSELFESEMFGVEKGAATGVARQLVGEFEHAGDGTLLLDEIGAASPAHQAKLLRVLQERQFSRVGGREPIAVRCGVLAATQENVEQRSLSGEFRQDLYDRFQRVLHIPPLRERPEDVEPIANWYLEAELERSGKEGIELAEDALAALLSSGLPKNVRSVQQVISRAVAAKSSHSVIRAADLMLQPEHAGHSMRPAGVVAAEPQSAVAPSGAVPATQASDLALPRGALKQLRDATAREERRLASLALERCRHPVSGRVKVQPAMQYLMDDPSLSPTAAKRILLRVMGATQRDELSIERVEEWIEQVRLENAK